MFFDFTKPSTTARDLRSTTPLALSVTFRQSKASPDVMRALLLGRQSRNVLVELLLTPETLHPEV